MVALPRGTNPSRKLTIPPEPGLGVIVAVKVTLEPSQPGLLLDVRAIVCPFTSAAKPKRKIKRGKLIFLGKENRELISIVPTLNKSIACTKLCFIRVISPSKLIEKYF
jgi:hypothetical protein